ncbi:MAG: hypothetical protein QXY82_06150 [Desulfurococcaceae archaeon]
MFPRGVNAKVLNSLVHELRMRGLWAERHSYSIRIAYNGLFVASLHLYPGFNEAVLRLYGRSDVNRHVQKEVEALIRKYFPDYVLRAVVLRQTLG